MKGNSYGRNPTEKRKQDDGGLVCNEFISLETFRITNR